MQCYKTTFCTIFVSTRYRHTVNAEVDVDVEVDANAHVLAQDA